jgi:hypothetical protein
VQVLAAPVSAPEPVQVLAAPVPAPHNSVGSLLSFVICATAILILICCIGTRARKRQSAQNKSFMDKFRKASGTDNCQWKDGDTTRA